MGSGWRLVFLFVLLLSCVRGDFSGLVFVKICFDFFFVLCVFFVWFRGLLFWCGLCLWAMACLLLVKASLPFRSFCSVWTFCVRFPFRDRFCGVMCCHAFFGLLTWFGGLRFFWGFLGHFGSEFFRVLVILLVARCGVLNSSEFMSAVVYFFPVFI